MKLVARTTGAPIKAIIDTVPRDDHVNLQKPILTGKGGERTINHTGETVFGHSGADTLMTYGEALYVCAQDNVHLAGDLQLVHDDGRVEPIEGTIQPKPTSPFWGASRALRALEYANWVLHSTHALMNEEIDQITHDRVQARAREYARAAGIEDLLDAILAATSQKQAAS